MHIRLVVDMAGTARSCGKKAALLAATFFFIFGASFAEASKLNGYFKLTVPNDSETIASLAGINDMDFYVPPGVLWPESRISPKIKLKPGNGGADVFLGNKPRPDVTQIPGPLTQFRYLFGPINPQAGDMYIFTISQLNTGALGARFSFTKDGNRVNIHGRDFFDANFFGSDLHRVTPRNSFNFEMGLHNASYELNYGEPRPVVFSDLRVFTDVNFGQTTFAEATAAIESYLAVDNPAGDIFGPTGSLLRPPPGTEVDLTILLTGFPGWDPASETLTLNQLDVLLPPYRLEREIDASIVFGEATWDAPGMGLVTANFAVAHQVSKLVPEPSSLFLFCFGLLALFLRYRASMSGLISRGA